MTANNIKIAFRHLQKNKFFSSLNIAGLAAGLVVALIIGLWVWDELSFNSHNPQRDRIAIVMQNNTFDGVVETWWSQPKQTAPALRDQYGSHFEHVALSSFPRESVLSKGTKVLNRQGRFAEQGMAEMLGLEMIHGSWAALEDPQTILIAATTAKAFFGTMEVVGETLTLNETDEMTVGGVYVNLPENAGDSDTEFLGAWSFYEKTLPEWVGWGNSWFQVTVELNPGEDLATVSELIKNVKYDNASEDDGKRFNPQLWLHPMSDWHLHSKFENGVSVGGRISSVRSFGVIGIVVLLLGCINFMNLSTARSEQRALEVGIRKTMGSRRGQLIGQFYSESLLLAFFSGAVALGLCYLLLPLFNQIAEKNMELPLSSPGFWAVGIGVCTLTGLLAGSYPALYLSGFSPLSVMRGGGQKAGKARNRPRQALVVLQFTVSVVLIVGTIVINQQIQFAKDRPIGFEDNGLVGMRLRGEKINDQFDAFRQELLKTGKIAAVAKSDNAITSTFVTNSGFDWSGKPADFQDEFVTVRVSHEFGETIGWEMKAGRDFSREHSSDTLAFVINEAAASYFGFEDPIGQRVEWGEGEYYTIIGVVKNLITQSPYSPTKQTMFFIDEDRSNYANFRIDPAVSTGEALAAIEGVFSQYDPVNNFEYTLLDEKHAKKFGEEERIARLATVFTILAIFISCLGLFGMAAYVAERRAKEIGIRKVLGATIASVVGLISADFLVLVFVSLLVATPIAYYLMQSWLADFAYRVSLQWWMFVVAGGLAVFVAFFTVAFQSLRAALINPVESLRS